ncbi:phospholipid carrier-dependent glycosyltransferase [Aphanothece hegewaldii CCALA 016]|uniref:Phospholipid carrier-dependent glycosyltransferase n=1 Tax=Aphanothece hegewaldii CCALA 016 TaxID=2107694 RepID=A0A2T1LZ79_9CHRO|nr:glycosyltransferase family 39 protein [Aphanothece hegewaldii]PSF37646.1 phospholipid carrier-dependent glycosyltransferase [Aphanothece hegewaldii CCALA 016]
MKDKKELNWEQGLVYLTIIWLVGVIIDRFWFAIDQSIPAWDQADYLNGVVNYWEILQKPDVLNGEWWRQFWLISPKIPPLTYLLTTPFFSLFGVSLDSGTLVMLLYSAILLISVYGLGVILFNVSVGLWASIICLIIPGFYYYRLEFLLDFPLAAIVTFSFWLLTIWHCTKRWSWLKAGLFGISFGLALFVKQTSLFFLFIPIFYLFISYLFRKKWLRLSQLIISLFISFIIIFPWVRTNWLLMLTSGKRATIDSAIIEGDPALNTLDAWTYYFKVLPYFLSWVLLLIPIVGFLMSWIYWNKRENILTLTSKYNWFWLGLFLLGGYLLSSVNINKDARYILPLLPVLSIILAVGFLSWRGRWSKIIRWGTVGIGFILMLLNLFPLGGNAITEIFSPKMQHQPYIGKPWYHEEVVQEIIKTSPYLQETLGVLPSTPQLNQHTFSFYGGKYQSQISGRQVGVREKEIEQDARSLNYFITKNGDQGSIPDAQKLIVKRVEQGLEFKLQKQWKLPDQSDLFLYRKKYPNVTVLPFTEATEQVKLEEIITPSIVQANQPIPVTYKWSGSWEQLQNGVVLLTWKKDGSSSSWIHDHGIGMGRLRQDALKVDDYKNGYEVIERTAMLADGEIEAGNYTLEAVYLNRKTQENYSIAVPPITIKIDPLAPIIPAPELDLVTQLRILSSGLSQGIKGLDPVFKQTARINQYDANQDYLVQADTAFAQRLRNNDQGNRLQWSYALALSNVLQQDVKGAIAAINQVIEIAPNNPYNYAYLAFVYLYDWNPHEAEKPLQTALKLDPNIPELNTLSGVTALMQGNLIKAWTNLRELL